MASPTDAGPRELAAATSVMDPMRVAKAFRDAADSIASWSHSKLAELQRALVVHDITAPVRASAQPKSSGTQDRAVVLHLVRLIQENPDVRYYVGGHGSQMRELLLAAIAAAGFEGDPSEALKPAAHRRDDLTQVEQLRRQIDELRAVNGGYRG